MVSVLALLVFALLAMIVVRPGQATTGQNVSLPRIEYQSFWLGLAFFAIVFSVFKEPHAFGLVIGLVLHELGHYAAYRHCGHTSARFRLLPMVASVASSDKQLRSETEEAFVALSGAGISLVLMVPLMALGYLVGPQTSDLHYIVMPIGGTIAALNALNLLPLWPLDGGRCLALISHSLAPRATGRLLLATSAFTAALGIYLQSTTLLMTCLAGAHIIYYPSSLSPKHAAMPARRAVLVAMTWAALFAAHLSGGWWMLNWFYFSGL